MFYSKINLQNFVPTTLKLMDAAKSTNNTGKDFIVIRLFNDSGVLTIRTFAGKTDAQKDMLERNLISPVLTQLHIFSCKDVDDFIKQLNKAKDAELKIMSVPQEGTNYTNYIWDTDRMNPPADDDNLDF